MQGQNIDDVAREVSWQCVAISNSAPDEAAVVGEVTPLSQAPRPAGKVFDGTLRMTSLSHGEVVNAAYKNAKDLFAQEADLAQKYNCVGEFEPRMLRIPGLLVTTVWLKSQTGGTDWVVPLHTKIGDLLKKELFTMDEFLNITRPLAGKRLESTTFD